ncbi:MAG TPA: exodeoxyribonuclease V subunit gamma, partial [Solirubrobacteraceae bacterium]|nr:exodeoxyribonuclease V subunit gamma [Solirubrobacteraceae bacterium]
MLHIHRAERADRLADGLAETLEAPLDDPFTPDVVAVPTRGIERWLAQRLSTRLGATGGRQDGVCANVEFPFPGRLIRGALAAATGIDPENDPWAAERSVWPLLEVVDECLGE